MSIRFIAGVLGISAFLSQSAAADSAAGVEARIVVTVADHIHQKPKLLKVEDIEDAGSMRVATITPLHGDVDLYVMIDNAANFDFGSKLQELRHFVNSQPASTAIGVAFITNGELSIAQLPEKGHQSAARALHAPSGSKPSNPYCALSQLIAGWTDHGQRREVLMISSGIDSSSQRLALCENADTASADAQRAGVVVYSIYHPLGEYDKQQWKQIDNGIVELAHVSFETGGEAYFISHSPMETISPFLADITEHIANQYLVTFVVKAPPQSGFQWVWLYTGTQELDLMAPSRVWVETKATPAGKVAPSR